jgi:hypothetical protein
MLAAGVSWRLVIASAGWAGRIRHTSVIDAAGAIYVIGGSSGAGGTYFQDVVVSTDGGARAGLCQGVVGGVLQGVVRGCYKGYSGYSGARQWYVSATSGVLRSTQGT